MSNVTPLGFRNALFTAFDAFWADRTQIAVPNVDFDPDKIPSTDTAWVRLFILGDAAGQQRLSGSVEPQHFGRTGIFTIEIYVRQNADLDEAYALADDALSFLEGNGVADMKFSNLSSPQELGTDGTWFQLSVSAAWVYWTDRAA